MLISPTINFLPLKDPFIYVSYYKWYNYFYKKYYIFIYESDLEIKKKHECIVNSIKMYRLA